MGGVVAATTNRSEGTAIAKKVTDELKKADRRRRRPSRCPRTIPPTARRTAGRRARRLPWAPCPRRRPPRPAPARSASSTPGVGGLTVLHELLVSLPHEDFVYLGDTARFPYGERTPAELERFCAEIAEELIARAVKLLVVACNTATAAALPALRRRMMETTLGVDVLAVVRPEAVARGRGDAQRADRPAGDAGDGRERRVRRGARRRSTRTSTLVAVPCPDLAPIIQRGFPFDDDVVETVRAYVRAAARGARSTP